MNKKVYNIMAFSAASAMLLCGCSSGNSSVTETSASASVSVETSVPSETSAEESVTVTERVVPPMDTTPITLSLYVDDPEYAVAFDTLVAQEIIARTGVTLEIIVPEDETGLDTMLESGEIPDLIYAGERTDELIENGTLIELDGYNEKVGEFFTEMYGENIDSLRADDRKLYTFGTGGSTPSQFTAEGTFQIQYAVLAELGYPEIKTLDQLGDCLRQYKELHPNSNGLLLCGGPQQKWLDTVSLRINYLLGCPDDGEFIVNEETGEAVYKWTDERTGRIVKWLNQMYNDGILDEKSFSLKHAAYIARISEGNVSAIADFYEDYPSAEETLGEYDKIYCPIEVTLEEGTAVPFLADYGDFAVADGIGITTACEEPERAFRFLDWWCSDEAQKLVNYATEDINTEFDPASETYYKDTGAGLYAEPFPMRGLTEKNADGEYYSAAVNKHIVEYTEPQTAAAEAYGVTLLAEMFPQMNELPVYTRTLISDMEIHALSEEGILLESLGTYIKTEVQNAIMLPVEEFDAKWNEIVDWCNSNGAQNLSDIMTERVQKDMGIK
ncbi:MAG: extracellular solute-binding protein [Oscillospiraceae bacterium]|nr:extracellular solute-binding protein [Oscillospiraceae bacterium]